MFDKEHAAVTIQRIGDPAQQQSIYMSHEHQLDREARQQREEASVLIDVSTEPVQYMRSPEQCCTGCREMW